jgi:hypothetical protein
LDFLSQLTVEDMPNQEMRWVAEDCGLDVAIEMIRRLRGARVYVPNIDLDNAPQTPEDMPNSEMRLVAEMCGLEIAMKLLRQMGGVTISIPIRAAWTTKIIRNNFNGDNACRLAVLLGISRSRVYEIARCDAHNIDTRKRSRRLETLETG